MPAVDPTSPLETLRWACESTETIVRNVGRDELAKPTPCSEWTVADLINHIVGATQYFGDLAESGDSPDDEEWPVYTDGDYATLFTEQARRLLDGFSTPTAMERVMQLPTAPSPGSLVIQVATGEIFVHGWDLARATGQQLPADPGVAECLWASSWPALSDQVRNEHPSIFAPALPIAAGRPTLDQLLGFLGRDPEWTGPDQPL
jgi:uncharacterized protein (TIGR03086 family)